jgi:Sulfotransferase family
VTSERGAVSPPAPFIVGAPRSGTTLLRLMLDAHPALAIPAETHFYRAILALDAAREDLLGAVIEAITSSHTWGDYGLDAEAFARAARAAAPRTPGDVLRTFYRTYAARFGKERWGDKFPGNVLLMRGIAGMLPEARFVHIIRDGRDVAASLREMWFRPGDTFERCIAWWAELVRAARDEASAGLPYLELRYESLVRDPEAELRRVCAFVELPYDPAMLAYHRGARERLAEMGDWNFFGRHVPREVLVGIHARTAAPPSDERVGRWRGEISGAELAACERAAGGLLEELGYA